MVMMQAGGMKGRSYLRRRVCKVGVIVSRVPDPGIAVAQRQSKPKLAI